MSKAKHVMEFKSYPDTTTPNPSVLVAHQVELIDLTRYEKETGQFRGQNLNFEYAGVAPKVGEFLVRFDDEFKPLPIGQVVLVGARRFYQIVGDNVALNDLGKLGNEV